MKTTEDLFQDLGVTGKDVVMTPEELKEMREEEYQKLTQEKQAGSFRELIDDVKSMNFDESAQDKQVQDDSIMANSRQVRVNDKLVTIRELNATECLLFLERETEDGPANVATVLKKVLPLAIVGEGIDGNWLLQLTPSQLLKLWEIFKEVNEAFLQIAEWAGIGTAAKEIIAEAGKTISTELKAIVPILLRGAMRKSLNIPGHSSKSHKKRSSKKKR